MADPIAATARIDRAIARIERAVATHQQRHDAIAKRHATLRAQIADAVEALDDVIAREERD
ncbi:hypothetical protein ACFO8O_04330 [Hephaestia sp. GCM10023244]|uniref:hypothetical protein n=1 Tax=unclassified Hephaestia TaxID=2631281 RepID=UPI0020778C8C|nr:hypothetical protein [Hephaestia sp. MAHUQ-44]MCM8730197.1 hypothetical protein [Hephaestia sp. MAHUQ-44]